MDTIIKDSIGVLYHPHPSFHHITVINDIHPFISRPKQIGYLMKYYVEEKCNLLHPLPCLLPHSFSTQSGLGENADDPGKVWREKIYFFRLDEVHVVKLHIFIVILDQNDNEYMQLDDVHFVGKYIFFPEFSRISGRHPPS